MKVALLFVATRAMFFADSAAPALAESLSLSGKIIVGMVTTGGLAVLVAALVLAPKIRKRREKDGDYWTDISWWNP